MTSTVFLSYFTGYATALIFLLIGYTLRALFDSNKHAVFDLIDHLHRQRRWSLATFGPGARTEGVVDHICSELSEIIEAPADVTEWVDVVLLALDGAWRAGHTPEHIANAIAFKQRLNESRQWPDWRTAEPGKAIEHVKGESTHG